jgi:hypothetical protein
MSLFWKSRMQEQRVVPDERDVLLLPVLLSALAGKQTSRSGLDIDDFENSAFCFSVTHAVRKEDGSGEYAEGRWEERSRGSIDSESWDYRVAGRFRAGLCYGRADFPDAAQPDKCFALRGEVCGTGIRWEENATEAAESGGAFEVPGLRIPFAAQVLCYADASPKREAADTSLPWG